MWGRLQANGAITERHGMHDCCESRIAGSFYGRHAGLNEIFEFPQVRSGKIAASFNSFARRAQRLTGRRHAALENGDISLWAALRL